jgi:tRNA A-37 threonylcarbamoyl transferase component Bud32
LTAGTGKEETREAAGPLPEVQGPPQAIASLRIGELVGGKYRISRFLAEGGMGVVYEAQHEIVRRRFAVKFLRPDYARRREFLGRFQREAEAAGALESEHIASAVDFGVAADGSPFIVMEYLVGEDLASLLAREGPLPLERAADLCVQACHGAEVAHAAGILHRDLKPKNLFIGRREDGSDLLKILDFGVAKLAPLRYDHATTDTGTVMGTPAYMSPEQARGEKALDARSDVYALGAILFEILSRQLPHPGDSPNAILHHIATRPAVSLADAAPGLPSALVETVDRALAADPGARPPSASALASGLAPFAKRQVWPERPNLELASGHAGVEAEPSPDPSFGKAGGVKAGRARHRGWRRGVLLAAAAALVAGAVVVVLRGRSPQPVPKAMTWKPWEGFQTFPRSGSAGQGPASPSRLDIPPPIPGEEPAVGAGPGQPATAVPPPSPSAAAPAAPGPSDTAERAPARPAAPERTEASGHPHGRPRRRPIQRSEAASAPSAHDEPDSAPARNAGLRGSFEEWNPYAHP